MAGEFLVAVVVGLVQGIFEWLPISSEGNVAIALRALDRSAEDAVAYALFLHVGTAVSATAYYRDEFADVLAAAPEWRPASAFSEHATLSYIGVAMAVSGVVGIVAYAGLKELVSELAGGAFVALVGVLLILTGVLQRYAQPGIEDGGASEAAANESDSEGSGATESDAKESGSTASDAKKSDATESDVSDSPLDVGDRDPDAIDAVFVGAMQGLAILPGVSRSGTTASALLFRGHSGENAFRLSFLLSVPAALAAGALEVVQAGGIPGAAPAPTVVAVVVAAVVGYATIGALMAVVERVSFWLVCVGLGLLAVVGGLVVLGVT